MESNIDTPSAHSAQPKPYKLGVALSGGGARGIAHAGALKAIEEAGLKPDIIAGVSAGSVAAVMYAAGLSPEKILGLFLNAKFSDFGELTWGKGGLIKIDKFIKFLTKNVGKYKNIEDLPMPTYIGVTNFDLGVPEVFSQGKIGPIVQASCSIPIAMPPVMIEGVSYVDGGVLRNLPAWTIRDKCEMLIGVNVSPVDKAKLAGSSILEIAMRTYTLLAKSNQYRDMEMCDLVVETKEISHHRTFDLNEVAKIFRSGYLNTRKALKDKGLWKTGK